MDVLTSRKIIARDNFISLMFLHHVAQHSRRILHHGLVDQYYRTGENFHVFDDEKQITLSCSHRYTNHGYTHPRLSAGNCDRKS